MRDFPTVYPELEALSADPDATNRGERLKALRAEVSAIIAEGAQPCPVCNHPPHGMLKTPPAGDQAPVFEIGCLVCLPPNSPRARGWMPGLAVKHWNEGKLVKERVAPAKEAAPVAAE